MSRASQPKGRRDRAIGLLTPRSPRIRCEVESGGVPHRLQGEHQMIYLAVTAAAAFNLVCTGTTEKTEYSGSKSEPYSITYRVDTVARLWCNDDAEGCKTPQNMADINAVTIKFIDTTTDTPSQYFRYVEQVNRETGLHQTLIVGGRGAYTRITKQEGHCEPAPFSGFPKASPRF